MVLFAYILLIIIGFLGVSLFVIWRILIIKPKFPIDKNILKIERTNPEKNFYKLGENWLKKNSFGVWELYVSGNPYQLGVYNGILCKELIEIQEKYFINEIKKIIPNTIFSFFLKLIVGFMNRKIDYFIPQEYLIEIYGVSIFAPQKYRYVASNYQRYLNYHAANDIGHALEDMNMVACTSFSVWNDKSKDGSLLVGRNFDFYFGDNFAQEKIVSFYKPEKGFKFIMITWGGMIGAVSGMNDNGLTVTMNSVKSSMPTTARTPLCIIGREILQYASTIAEAFDIAKKHETFISASFMIGSAKDKKSAVIEKSITNTFLFETDEQDFIACTNHFQSKEFADDPLNIQNIKESASEYRLLRTKELIKQKSKTDVNDFVEILRNQKGINEEQIGISNEKAINQMIAHHSIIFKPEELKVWVSTNNFQLGEFICYDLNEIFSINNKFDSNIELFLKENTIKADNFIHNGELDKYKKFKVEREELEKITKKKLNCIFSTERIDEFISLNPLFYNTYYVVGEYYFAKKDIKNAELNYKIAISKEIAKENERVHILNRIKKCHEFNNRK